jgi:hypothetical protein
MTQIIGSSNTDDLSDPQIAWDQLSGRWITVAMDLSHDATDVAVSNAADPLGGWVSYTFPFGSTLCPDQPRLGFSSTVVVVATELFYGNCHFNNPAGEQGAVMLVADKQALLAEADNPMVSQYGPSADYAHYVPVQMLEPSPIDYITSTDEGTTDVVHVFELQNVPPNDTLTEQDSLLIHPLMNPTPAIERGGRLIKAGDDRINDVSWHNGTLYLAADDSCSYPNDRYPETCARVMEISTQGGQSTLIGENDIGIPNGDAYYAAIRPDADGNAIVVFDYSDPGAYPSIAATAAIGPIVGEQGGNFTQPVALALGTSPTIDRWGDYSGAAVDPTNPSIIWTVGQVADDLSGPSWRWATHIDSVSLSSGIPGELRHDVDPGYLYRGRTTQREPISIRPAGGGGHVKKATVVLKLSCRARRHQQIIFELTREGRQTIGLNGHFSLHQRWGADHYATGYSITLTGTVSAPGRVSGTVSGVEHSRTFGVCRARGVTYSIHD